MRTRILTVSAALAMALTGGAVAQGTDPDDTEALLVIGQRSSTQASAGTKDSTKLVETPQSITVVDRSELDQLNIQSLDQALRYVPGAAPDTRGASGSRYDFVNLRGFAPDQYLDGLKLVPSSSGYAAPQIDITRLDRIEVIEGPASVLYGQASPGGIIALTSRTPLDATFGEVEALGGSFGTGQLDFDVNRPLDASHTILFRMDGAIERSDTEIAHTEGQRLSLSPSVRFRPDAQTDWTLLYSYQRDPKNGSYGALPQQGSLLPNPNGRIAEDFNSTEPDYERYGRTDNAITSLFRRDLGDGWALHQSTRFEHLTTYYRSVYSFSIDPDLLSIPRFADVAYEQLNNLATDTRISGAVRTGPVNHGLLFGVDYQRTSQSEAAGFAGAASDLNLFNPVYGLPVTDSPITFDVALHQQQTGVYAQDQLSSGGFRLLLSGRYDWLDQTVDDLIGKTSSPLDQSKFTYRAGLLYLTDIGLAPYISYATSFQPQSATDRNGDVLAPTEGKQAEIGLKYQPHFWNTLLTFSLYDLRETNVATQDPGAPQGFSIAAGEIRSRGIEAGGHANPLPNLKLDFAYTYLDNKVTKDDSGLQGTRPYGVPQQTASAFGVYTFDGGILDGFGIGGGFRYIGQSYNGVAGRGSVTVPPVGLVDLIASYDFGKLRPTLRGLTLNLNVRNLGNTRYINACYSTIWCWYGDRTDAQAALRYRF